MTSDDMIILALARKAAQSGAVSNAQINEAIVNYFNSNPDSIVTNSELSTAIESVQAESIATTTIQGLF